MMKDIILQLANDLIDVAACLKTVPQTERDGVVQRLRDLITTCEDRLKGTPGEDVIPQISQTANVLNFMQDNHDPMEEMFIEDISETLTQAGAELKKCIQNHEDCMPFSEDVETSVEVDEETKEFVAAFIEEASDFLDELEPVIDDLPDLEPQELYQESVNKVFRLFHSLKGLAGFLNFNVIQKVTHEAETLLDFFRKPNAPKISRSRADLIFDVCGFIREGITIISTDFSDQSLQRRGDCVIALLKQEITVFKGDFARDEAEKPMGEILKDLGMVDAESLERALELQKGDMPLGEILVELGKTSKKDIDQVLGIQKQSRDAAPVTTPKKVCRKDIRVDTNKLDQLFDLVGELITVESMVVNNPDLQGFDLPNFAKAANMLNKITRSLQEVTMSVRMTPLDGLFNRMKRLVRDLSKKSNKEINLNISGGETEMDKNVIEELSDPMVHILRNAVDHGIESPENRVAKGKKSKGEIGLSATYEGNEILITVCDDGGGLSQDKILKKAVEKGILKKDPSELKEEEIFQLVFEPGFSTADQVSDISGRGVGMDVVRRNIEKLRGYITVDSEIDRGTQFILRIPLTLAIMDVMMVRVGQTRYAIPIMLIQESFRPDPDSVTITMDGQEIVKVREDLYSVLRLHEIYSIPPDFNQLNEGILIMVESRSKKICLFVDEILGQQQTVIKGLSDYIGKIEGITGCMILSDGEIGLILDIEGLIALSE